EAACNGNFQNRDELYEAAVDIVIRERRGSCSLLQRALGIGYGRAARLIDFMAEDGVVGQYNGSQARDVLISLEDWESRHQDAVVSAAPIGTALAAGTGNASPKERTPATSSGRMTAATVEPRRRNKIVPAVDEPSDLDDEAQHDTDEHEEYDHEEWDDEVDESEDEDDGDEELADDDEWEDEAEDDSDEEVAEDEETDEEDEALEQDDEEVDYDDEEWEDVEEEDEVAEEKKDPEKISIPHNRRTRATR
ncbi:MAG TPA: DNA translocase FtsK, partial [Lacipirellulaceae bacterium]|nr:DNA translocase FtsK [Lacipirellulaceae bacterium]